MVFPWDMVVYGCVPACSFSQQPVIVNVLCSFVVTIFLCNVKTMKTQWNIMFCLNLSGCLFTYTCFKALRQPKLCISWNTTWPRIMMHLKFIPANALYTVKQWRVSDINFVTPHNWIENFSLIFLVHVQVLRVSRNHGLNMYTNS